MKTFTYFSAEPVQPGDRITYHGEEGEVEFVISERTGDPALDWYIEQFPDGGFMIKAEAFGNVFLTAGDIDEDLTLISRSEKK